jgi:alpha-amylase/alpha-mannosidase (GH57 family)
LAKQGKMSADNRLNVVLCWHMHQPQYQDQGTGTYIRPWTYLHAIKDYIDMAAHLAAVPDARAVVNFAPILIEQLQDYATQLDDFFARSKKISDPLLNCLAQGVPEELAERVPIAKQCLQANQERLIDRFEPYRRLADFCRQHLFGDTFTGNYINRQFFSDLVVWYHLAWVGETVRRCDPRMQRLINKEKGYSQLDRIELLRVIADIMKRVLSEYRSLAEHERVELAMSPYGHPMLPLLADFGVARHTMPRAPLPVETYPGGLDRVDWHLHYGREVFKRILGVEPVGCWPSEGGVSDAVLLRLKEHGFRWFASGQGVLANSLRKSGKSLDENIWPHRAYRFRDTDLYGFFRHDGLSDTIGFEYATWHGDDAVGDLIHKLDQIARRIPSPEKRIVSIIMDGENAWEHFPDNAYHFLHPLFELLAQHSHLKLTTYSEYLKTHTDAGQLDTVSAGSWVYGTFSTWIGQSDKNRAWDILVGAKKQCDKVLRDVKTEVDKKTAIEKQLGICEGSDWFWWFGDDNPPESVNEFAMIYRNHIAYLYKLIGLQAPDALFENFGYGGHAEHGGVMRRGRH